MAQRHPKSAGRKARAQLRENKGWSVDNLWAPPKKPKKPKKPKLS